MKEAQATSTMEGFEFKLANHCIYPCLLHQRAWVINFSLRKPKLCTNRTGYNTRPSKI